MRNRLKFAVASDLLEVVNPYIPGKPHEKLVRQVGNGRVGRVLELCAGTGYASRLLAGRHPEAEVVGLDLSREMIAVGNRKLAARGPANVRLVEGDAGSLPFEDNTFDTVMAVFGLHEVPTTVRHAAVRESARVLGPGGRIVVVDLDKSPRSGALLDAYLRVAEPRHAREICGSGLVNLLSDNGFTVDHHAPAEGWGATQTVVATVRPA
ncbi:class I SAM-dependent methyltransferase [Nocardia sp. NPDC055321]